MGTCEVAMVIQRYAPVVGGGELQLERLLPHLGERGVHARVLTRAAPGAPSRECVGGIAVRRSRDSAETAIASIVYVAMGLADVVRRRRTTDVVHAHGVLSPATVALGASFLGIAAVVTPLGAGPQGDLRRLLGKPAGRLRLRLLARRADFVALSRELAAEIAGAGVAAARIHVIPNGVDTTTYRPADPVERDRLRRGLGLGCATFTAVFVGRLHRVKNVEVLLDAMTCTPDVELVIAGDGDLRARLEERAAELGVASRVRFFGMRDDVPDILKACDAFVLPSHGEGMSNALIEAMACGLPCLVATAVGGAAELVGTTAGITLPADDADAWAAALGRLAADRERGVAIGARAADHVHTNLSFSRTAEQLSTLYRTVSRSR